MNSSSSQTSQTEIQPPTTQNQKQNQDETQTKRQKIAALTKRAATFVYNNAFVNIIVCFILCNIIHHYTSKLYVYFCAYSTPLFQLNSVLMSPIVIISPHCMALRWLILETSNTVYFQILACCSWIISRLSK
jgi:hypothetical protein